MVGPPLQRQHLLTIAGIATLSLGLVACQGRVNVHGNAPEPEQIAEIVPGTHTRLDVEQILGSPSSVSMFDNEVWYYIGTRTETLAFFAPEVMDRKVLVVRFDAGGVVRDWEEFDKERGREVEIVDRKTPTLGNEITIWDQIVGNIGRFEE